MTPADCDTSCGEAESNQTDVADGYVIAAVSKETVMQGYSAVNENTSAGGVNYSRAVVLFIDIECVGVDLQWQALAVLSVNDYEETEPFYSGIGPQKRKTLDIYYSKVVKLGCASAIDDITAVASLSGVTINGTAYSWDVTTYSEVCEELDGNLEYQPCTDYLEPNVQELTVTFSKIAGC